MDADLRLTDCPAYLGRRGSARCGLPAEVEYCYPITSTDGPLDSAKIRCPAGHVFNGLLESLTWAGDREPAPALPAAAGSA
jgi:hypothetical protein